MFPRIVVALTVAFVTAFTILYFIAPDKANIAANTPSDSHRIKTYKPESFVNAIAQGKNMVVHIHADWCPACQRQQPVLRALSNDLNSAAVEFIQVNFDQDKEFLIANNVAIQSVVIIFKNGREVKRIAGVVDEVQLSQQINAALSL